MVALHDAHNDGLDDGPIVIVRRRAREVADPDRPRAPRTGEDAVGLLGQQPPHTVEKAGGGHADHPLRLAAQLGGRADVDVAGLHGRPIAGHSAPPHALLRGRELGQARQLAPELEIEDEVVDIEEEGHAIEDRKSVGRERV